jgi:hypothetical protein
MSVVLIFVASFASVGLGCFQTINVVNGWRWRAATTSLVQGSAALTLYRYAPHVSTLSAATAFLLGGICGGQLSLWVTRQKGGAPERVAAITNASDSSHSGEAL